MERLAKILECKVRKYCSKVCIFIAPPENRIWRRNEPSFRACADKMPTCSLQHFWSLGLCVGGLDLEYWNIQDGGYYGGVKLYYFVCFPRIFHNQSLLNWRNYLEIT